MKQIQWIYTGRYERHNYTGATEKLEILKEEVPDPNLRRSLELAFLLAGENP